MYRNSEGYSDPTAGMAMNRIMREYRQKLFSVKQISPFSSSEFPIVIVGKSPLSAGFVRKHVPLLHPAA